MRSSRFVTATVILFGALIFGAPQAVAAPPPANQTDIAAPMADPVDDPEPPACPEGHLCPAEPCETDCEPVEEPEEEPVDNPDEPAQPEEPQQQVDQPEQPEPGPVAKPVGQPRSAPIAIPTPSRIDTGEGPGEPVNWWLIGLPALALLGLAAGGAYAWITRTERSAR